MSVETKLEEISAKLDQLLAQSADGKADTEKRQAEDAAERKRLHEHIDKIAADWEASGGLDKLRREQEGTPEVPVAEAEPEETVPYRDQPAKAGHRSERYGGTPPVRVGAPDPTKPGSWLGVPQWEEGRQPHQVLDTSDPSQDPNSPVFRRSQRRRLSKRVLRNIQNPQRRDT